MGALSGFAVVLPFSGLTELLLYYVAQEFHSTIANRPHKSVTESLRVSFKRSASEFIHV